MKLRLKQALKLYNSTYAGIEPKLTQKAFGEKYFGMDKINKSKETAITRMFQGKVVNIDVVKCAEILRTSTDFLLGKTAEYQPCKCVDETYAPLVDDLGEPPTGD